MPVKTYTIVEINAIEDLRSLGGSPQATISLGHRSDPEFHLLFNNTPPHNAANLFCASDKYNQQLQGSYSSVVEDMRAHNNCGFFVFKDVQTLGHDSLIVDETGSRIFIGQMLNWSRDYFKWWIEYSDVGFIEWEGGNTFVADFGDAASGAGEGVLMNSPGYGIFGHWLIDFVPRMALSKLIKSASSTKYFFGPLQDWMKYLISKAGIDDFDSVGTGYSKHSRLIVPSSTKLGYGFFEPINSLAWRSLALAFHADNVGCEFPSSERIFVSRRHWKGERQIGYYEELEALMAHLDFAVIYPETLSMSEQAWIFSRAKVIVGEDGSALHNIIFSAPGTRLGVLMDAGRCNLWHAGICHLLGHQIAYAPLQTTDDVRDNGLAETMAFVRRLTMA